MLRLVRSSLSPDPPLREPRPKIQSTTRAVQANPCSSTSEPTDGVGGFTDASTEELIEGLPSLSTPAGNASLCTARVVVIGGSIGGLAAAACLRSAGFKHVQVLERNNSKQSGAGIGLDDASVAVLKGLGIFAGTSLQPAMQRMRWTEERLHTGKTLIRQPFPYFSMRYSELTQALLNLLPTDSVKYSCKVVGVESLSSGAFSVKVAECPDIECDLVIAADGPRSSFRKEFGLGDEVLRFAGYAAWRGVIPESELPSQTRENLHRAFPFFGNCLYFIMGDDPRQSAVLYDIGNGLVNWLIYEPRSKPVAESGHTTSAATVEDVACLRHDARKNWGEAFGAVVEATPDPFWTDVYDIPSPLPAFAKGSVALLGDAAHPITPHMAKGSNLAIHDAFVLASVAGASSDISEMLQAYSTCRAGEAGRVVLLSRLLGRLRGGLLPEVHKLPADKSILEKALGGAGIRTTTLPETKHFDAVWKFVENMIPKSQRGFFLGAENPQLDLKQPEALPLAALNHISRETRNVERLERFYSEVLGLSKLQRPNFGFGGAWFQIPGGIALHIIEQDPAKPERESSKLSKKSNWPEERFIRRSHHIALTVHNIEAAKQTLIEHGISFAVNAVPNTSIVQLFFYDPDGNGIEIGNFDQQSKL